MTGNRTMKMRTMSKISIVGVEGSGKTTLMAAFGEKYERPDENGYSLDPKDERTYATISTLTGAMRNGEWPASTEKSRVNALSWTLLHRSGDRVDELCDLSFLDYAGEVYRLAFGQTPTDEERAPHAAQIAALKDHVESASALAILVNLSDVINGNRRDPKVQQMVFLTGNLIKMAVQRVGEKHVALVFSQADKYQEAIEALGGLPQVLDKYLPLVATRFPKLRMFAVSAVGRTVVDAQGNENPPPDYQPTGLEELMEWVSGHAKENAGSKSLQACKRASPWHRKPSCPESGACRPERRSATLKWAKVTGRLIGSVIVFGWIVPFLTCLAYHGSSLVDWQYMPRYMMFGAFIGAFTDVVGWKYEDAIGKGSALGCLFGIPYALIFLCRFVEVWIGLCAAGAVLLTHMHWFISLPLILCSIFGACYCYHLQKKHKCVETFVGWVLLGGRYDLYHP